MQRDTREALVERGLTYSLGICLWLALSGQSRAELTSIARGLAPVGESANLAAWEVDVCFVGAERRLISILRSTRRVREGRTDV